MGGGIFNIDLKHDEPHTGSKGVQLSSIEILSKVGADVEEKVQYRGVRFSSARKRNPVAVWRAISASTFQFQDFGPATRMGSLQCRVCGTQAERSRNENSWELVQSTSGKNRPVDQRDDYQEAKRTHERLYVEHGQATPDSTPRIKFDNDEVNKLLAPKSVPSVSRWYDHRSTSSSSSSWQAASWWKSSSWNERFF